MNSLTGPVSTAEQKKIARDLGIDFNDLSLKPSEKDWKSLATPSRREIRSTQLQA